MFHYVTNSPNFVKKCFVDMDTIPALQITVHNFFFHKDIIQASK